MNEYKNQQTNYDSEFKACLIGSSMIKHLYSNELFFNKKCFFKSISGGSINDVHQCLDINKNILNNCEIFVITIGSNDIDRNKPIKSAIQDFTNFYLFLNKTFPNAKFIINKLVPRTKTKYTNLITFENRRIYYNLFIQHLLLFKNNFIVITHTKFEQKQNLQELLSDGVHLSLINGVPIYLSEIKKIICHFNHNIHKC